MEYEEQFHDMFSEMNKCLQVDVLQVANDQVDLHLPKFSIDLLLKLLSAVKEIFRKEPIVLNVNSPITVIGDLHGHFLDLIRILQANGLPVKKQLLFLGDFVDRGEFSIETVIYIYLLKFHYPDNVKIIRGNHEFEYICSASGFSTEIQNFYGSLQFFYAFMESFSYFPLAAVIDDSILAVHGGIGPTFNSVEQIRAMKRPIVEFGDPNLDSILWSDPVSSANAASLQIDDDQVPIQLTEKSENGLSNLPPSPTPGGSSPFLNGIRPDSPKTKRNYDSIEYLHDKPTLIDGFIPSKRGSGYIFGKDVLQTFLERNRFTKLIRGHECVQDGILEAFDGLIVTVFSASNYCGTVGNKAATLTIKDRNNFAVKRFAPIPYFRRDKAVFPDSPPKNIPPRSDSHDQITPQSSQQSVKDAFVAVQRSHRSNSVMVQSPSPIAGLEGKPDDKKLRPPMHLTNRNISKSSRAQRPAPQKPNTHANGVSSMPPLPKARQPQVPSTILQEPLVQVPKIHQQKKLQPQPQSSKKVPNRESSPKGPKRKSAHTILYSPLKPIKS